MVKLDRRTGLLIGIFFGAAIWLLSPVITGRREPWDAGGSYYPAALFAAGVIGGALVPRQWASAALGVFGGQVLVLLGGVLVDPASGGLWPLGLLFLGLYSVVALLGAGLGASVRRSGTGSGGSGT